MYLCFYDIKICNKDILLRRLTIITRKSLLKHTIRHIYICPTGLNSEIIKC